MRSKRQYIAVYVDSMEKYAFFRRFIHAASQCGYHVLILTNRFSIRMLGVKDSIITILVRERIKLGDRPLPEHSRETIVGTLTISEAAHLYGAVSETFETAMKKYSITMAFILGGRNAAELAVTHVAQKHNLKTLYFELGNIPGKMFVDPQGTNADSSIYENVSILKKFPADASQWEKWKAEYFHRKRMEIRPPQSVKHKRIHASHLLDVLGFKILQLPFENNHTIIAKISQKIWQKKRRHQVDNYDVAGKRYIFFPMQVGSDSQLIFHSEIRNIQAIEFALLDAESQGLDLVVKLHPAEIDSLEFNKILALRDTRKFYIIDQPTFMIVSHCVKVITINSTVGMEALLLNKPVAFLGKSFFKQFDEELLKNYILSYLVELNYFETDQISPEIFRLLLGRAMREFAE